MKFDVVTGYSAADNLNNDDWIASLSDIFKVIAENGFICVSKPGDAKHISTVKHILYSVPPEFFLVPQRRFLDPNCGRGDFLEEVVRLRLLNGCDLLSVLSTTYGLDPSQQNVKECRSRVLSAAEEITGKKASPKVKQLATKNIIKGLRPSKEWI